MKYSLGLSNFLEEILSLSHSVVFLYFFALITEGFLICSCNSLELCIQMPISFLFSLAFRFSSFHSYVYGLPRQPFCFFAFLFHGDGLDPCCLYRSFVLLKVDYFSLPHEFLDIFCIFIIWHSNLN